jgi:hypothetical protein
LFAAYKDVTKHPNLVIGVNDAGEVVLQIYNDNGILLWDLGKDGLQNIKVNIKCKKFSLNIISNATNNYITSPQVMVGIL